MGCGQRLGDLTADRGHLGLGQHAAASDLLREVHSLDVLHDQPRALVVLDEVVHGHHVGVAQPSGEEGLAASAAGV